MQHDTDLSLVVLQGSPLLQTRGRVLDLDVVVVDGAVELLGGLPRQVDTAGAQHRQVGDFWGAGSYIYPTQSTLTQV